MGIRYATREQIKTAANINGASEDAAVDRLAEAQSRAAEISLYRRFYPLLETRTYKDSRYLFDGRRLWPCDDLLVLNEVTFGGDAISDATLEPANRPKPYEYIELGASYTPSEDEPLVVDAVWGYSNDEGPAGVLDGSINDEVTSIDVSNSAMVGVGDLLRLDDERLTVSEKGLKDTTATLADDVEALGSVKAIPVDDGTKLFKGEVVTVDAERMLIEDIAGNTLIVARAYDGSVLAEHSNTSSLYAPRTLTVERAAAGTEAAAHDGEAAIYRNVPPGLISEWIIAEVISARAQETSHYGRNVGQGDGQQQLNTAGLDSLRKRVMHEYERVEVTF